MISIIVPVYNVEKYLGRCVDSILSQTFSDFELILVDDGSTDNSGRLCEEYAAKDKRIRVIHKENGGLSSARNAGIDVAAGKYLGFVDSDDYIDHDMYEYLSGIIEKENADLAICGYYDCYCGRPIKKNEPYYAILNPTDALCAVFEGKISGASACNKLYKAEIFNNIRYPEGKTSEDAFVIVRLLMNTDRVVISSEQKYYYIHRSDSITTSRFTKTQFDVIEAYRINYDLVKTAYPELQQMAFGRLCWAYFITLDRMLLSKAEKEFSKEAEDIIAFLRENILNILRCRFLRWTRKLSAIALCVSFPVYKFISRIYCAKYLRLNE